MRQDALDYRAWLREELEKRTQKNPRYSLRAFAKTLALQPSQISRVLSGKKNLSSPSARLVAERVFESRRKRERFVLLVEFALAKKPERKQEILKKLLKHTDRPGSNIGLDAVRTIADWYHAAILELALLPEFSGDSRRISEQLGIPALQASQALQRLKALGLLVFTDGQWSRPEKRTITPTDIPSPAIREFHSQMIVKAKTALRTQSIERRHIVGKTLAIHRGDILELKQMIEEFRQDVSDFLQRRSVAPDAVYQLGIQLFELTDSSKGEK